MSTRRPYSWRTNQALPRHCSSSSARADGAAESEPVVVRVVGGQLVQFVAGQRGARMGDEAQGVVRVAGGASRREDGQARVGSVPDQGEEGGKGRVRLVHRATPFRSGIRCESEGLRDSPLLLGV